MGDLSFSWDSVEGAIGYILEHTPMNNFKGFSTKVYVTDPFYTPEDINPQWTNILWRVKPLGHRLSCDIGFSEVQDFESAVTSIAETDNEQAVKIFPNPLTSGSQLTITTSQQLDKAEFQVKIYDGTGSEVYNGYFGSITKNKVSLDVSELNSGIHFVKMIYDKEEFTHKVTIIN